MGQMLASFRHEYNLPETEKVTYSGRLDPLAHGEVLILTGDDVHKKDDFNKHDKVYKFTIMFGVSTDTGDILGIPDNYTFFQKLFHTSIANITESKIRKIAGKFIKTYFQKYPAYSAYNVNGVPLWELARAGKLPEKMPENKVTIYNLEVFKVYTKTSDEVLNECHDRINAIDGDFRQGWIKEGWGQFLSKYRGESSIKDMDKVTGNKIENTGKVFVFADMRATVSSGTYIRTLCEDIGKKLNIPALAYSIEREEIL